jgi:hypothetical protein
MAKWIIGSVLLGLVLCTQVIHVIERVPVESDNGGDSTSTDSSGDGCTDGDGGEF